MDKPHVLLTGAYWHEDFSNVLLQTKCPMTLLRLEQVNREHDFDLIVIAQSRPGQLEDHWVESSATRFVNTPVVLLCGSWCEGEVRSGQPLPGLIRVYWHQWQGRFENFVERITCHASGSWHLPKIATVADQIIEQCRNEATMQASLVGVSARIREPFEMIRDSLPGAKAIWLEATTNYDLCGERYTAICLDANSLTAYTEQRIDSLRRRFPNTPTILLLNFPRQSDLVRAVALGVDELISKPFQLIDLKMSIHRAAA